MNEATVQSLLDEREILRGLARFSRLIDGKRWDDLTEVFAADLTFCYGHGGEEAGIDALRRRFASHLDVCGPTQHLLGSIMVDVAGDRGVSRAYVQARHQRIDDRAGGVFDANGEYVDGWERRPQGWRIVRRDVFWSLHTGDPAVLGIGQSGLSLARTHDEP